MIGQLTNLNWMNILLAFLAYFFLGALWFTVFFSRMYRASLGRENEVLPKKAIFIIGPALCSLLITIVTAVLISALAISSVSGALEFAFCIGIGYLVANTVNIAINPNIPYPIFYGIISGTYHLVGITLVSLILVAMN